MAAISDSQLPSKIGTSIKGASLTVNNSNLDVVLTFNDNDTYTTKNVNNRDFNVNFNVLSGNNLIKIVFLASGIIQLVFNDNTILEVNKQGSII